jgi:hypothetical protein
VDSDSLILNRPNRTLAVGEAVPGHRVSYVEPAPMIDVMFDQLQYLLGHESKGCTAGCRDCIRLKQVVGSLLQPFRAADNFKTQGVSGSIRSKEPKKSANKRRV